MGLHDRRRAEVRDRAFERALDGEGSVARVKAESDSSDAGEVEVRLEPDTHGKRISGVVGSVTGV